MFTLVETIDLIKRIKYPHSITLQCSRGVSQERKNIGDLLDGMDFGARDGTGPTGRCAKRKRGAYKGNNGDWLSSGHRDGDVPYSRDHSDNVDNICTLELYSRLTMLAFKKRSQERYQDNSTDDDQVLETTGHVLR